MSVTREIAAPAATVWELLVDTRRWPEWGPTVTDVRCEPAHIGPGSAGKVRTLAGIWFPFEVTAYAECRSWSWRVAGVPATDHVLDTVDQTRCTASFSVPWPAAPYAAVLWLGLRRLAALAGGRPG